MEPLVDINIAVYNHAVYLRQTLDSVLTQETNFPFRLLIGDDCSTDGSVEILKEYETKYPTQIKVIFQPKNLGLFSTERNGLIILKNSTAKYIALLDGDDYWIDNNKLQKQVSFLEQNPDYSICFHRAYELFPGKEPHLFQGSEKEETYTIEDLANGNFIPTVSTIFRKGFIKEFPSWFCESPVGDYALHMMNARNGKIKYFPQPMAVYRQGSGMWSSQNSDTNYIRLIKLMDIFLREFPEKQVRKNLIQQKIKYLQWIKNWDADFDPVLARDEVIELINMSRASNEAHNDLIKDPNAIASEISFKTLMLSIFKKLSKKASVPRG